MKKKIGNVILIAIVFFMIVTSSVSFAGNIQDDLGNLEEYKGQVGNPTKFVSKAGTVMGIIQLIGVVLSVGMLIIIGFKYMLGSVEEKAEYKKILIPYVIGAGLIFSMTTLPNVIYKIMENF